MKVDMSTEGIVSSASSMLDPTTTHSQPIPIVLPSTSPSKNHPNLSSTSSKSSNSSLQRSDHFDNIDYKKLNRGISRATDNEKIVSKVRSEIALLDNQEEVEPDTLFVENPVYTFSLPDLTQYPDDFRTFLEKDLIAISTQVSLEQATRLNWWTSFIQRLYPLSTSGDGNCLLHAASLGIWGFHDRLLTLRKALHVFLSQSPRKEALWRRWKYQQSKLNEQSGLVYSEIEWRREWNAIVSMASSIPRLRRQSVASGSEDALVGAIYESLEEIHVLALAHVLRRPIIVVSDTVLKDMNGEDLAPIPFGGIYLPLECPPETCQKSPLLLAYDGGHFSALVAMDSKDSQTQPQTTAIPLVDHNHDLLPIQFNVDPGDEESVVVAESQFSDNLNLLAEYLEVLKLNSHSQQYSNCSESADGQNKNSLLGSIGRSANKLRFKLTRTNSQRNDIKKPEFVWCALIQTKTRTDFQDVLIQNYLRTAKVRYEQTLKEEKHLNDQGPRYGTGKSQFYANSDLESHEKVNQMVPIKSNLTNTDPTMYFCKSTFYQDSPVPSSPTALSDIESAICKADDCAFYANPNTDDYCSKCYQQQQLAVPIK